MRVFTLQPAVALNLGRIIVAWLTFFVLTDEAFAQRQDTTRVRQDTTRNQPYKTNKRPTYRPADRYGDPFSNQQTQSPLYLKDPNQMKLDVEIDTSLNYTIYEKIGDLNYRPASSMTFDEFKQYQDRQLLKSYWQSRSRAQDGESAVSGRSLIPKIFISPVLDRIFGGSYIELVPRGFVTLDFGASFQRLYNPSLPIRQQRNGGFEFDQQINMSVVGKIGEKLQVTANFDNNNSFDFQNNMKVEYTGFKEDILQKLEIGNVSLPLNNTLIQGAQNLFGVKARMQFGKLNVTTIATTQRGKASSIDIGGGGAGNSGQGRPFEIIASNYDDNRHFFLGQFFRDNYERALGNLPQIISNVNVTRVEVYVLNRNSDTQTLRNAVGLMDLGEEVRIYNPNVTRTTTYPGAPNHNQANSLRAVLNYTGAQRSPDNINGVMEGLNLVNGTDFEKITGTRKLAPTEYTFHPQLGYLTLTRKLQNDEILAVAYQYTYSGRTYTVGELSEDYAKLKDDEIIFLKLLRPRKVATRDNNQRIIPTWDLMMKNIYTLGVTQLTRDGFQLRIVYRDARSGVSNPQLQDGSPQLKQKQLIELFGLDRLNPVNDPGRDGNFDFVDNITVNTQTGSIIFPMLEPFGTGLRKAFAAEEQKDFLISKYAYDTLYRTTKADAELFATKNKFWLMGTYSAGSSKEILIPGFGVSQGSVRLYAGGIPLNEGTDYVVDYTFGKVTILNDAILSSGKNIEVQFEQSDPFAFQTRSLLGTRFDYKLNDDVNLGSTFLYYNERPIVSRNQIGTEPARNMQYGFDFNVNKKSRMLTKLVDALPIIQTKEQSSVTVSGEFAQLLPGTSNIIDGEGTAYIDDFENSATPYTLMTPQGWKLAAVPESEGNVFGTIGNPLTDNQANNKRAKLAWYTVDNQFYRDGGRFKPPNINEEVLKNHYVRSVHPQEIFPNKQLNQGIFYEQVFDLAYYPKERGPYNYNSSLTNFYSNPTQNWGGITTAIRSEVDFDKSNIEYIEFWMLDPFIQGTYGTIDDGTGATPKQATGGKLVFQLGTVSEDVVPDGKFAFENGLPPDGDLVNGPVASNAWGYVTTQTYLTNAFDNNAASRVNQDVGLDGASDAIEAVKFADLANQTPVGASQAEIDKLRSDPSGDNWKFYFGADLDNRNAKILERYKNYNGMEGNSPVISGSDAIAQAGSIIPDNEDLNADNTLAADLEEYYQYDMDLRPGQLAIGKEYIVDAIRTRKNNAGEEVTWYLFRIPVRNPELQYGNIQGFKSIKYARMLLTGFKDPVVLRLANFRMVGSRWRKYNSSLLEGGLTPTPENAIDDFLVSVVNLEENGYSEGNKPPYVIPPGVVRDRDVTSSVSRQLNEQSGQLCVDELKDGDGRAMYKNLSVDLFNYGRLKMYLHAHSNNSIVTINDDELRAFIRLGKDLDSNFYEIEIPLKITQSPISGDIGRAVWPEENEIDLAFDELYRLKADRDRGGTSLNQYFPLTGRQVGRHLIRIFGRPDLTSVQSIMIGVRNPRSGDRKTFPVCIWANEMRVTDFNRTPGWAVNTTISAKLADFATVNGAFRHTSFGFGGVSSKIFERTRDETTGYDLSANVNVDKLIPGNTGIKIPMFVSYEKTTIKPLYDPANPDLKLEAALQSFNAEQRSTYLNNVLDQSVGRSLNFVNVRKTKVKADAPSHIWDIENFALSYSYSDRIRTNFNLQESLQKQQKGSLAWTFNPKETGIEPFKNSKSLSSPWLKFIKDFNLSLMPSSLGFRADLTRSFTKTVYQNYDGRGSFLASPENFMKYFLFDRQYNLRWNLSKNLSVEYTARANASIDEPLDKVVGEIDTKAERDLIISEIKKGGRMKNFDQSVTVNYTLPLDKFPVTDWVGADYRYQVAYNWKAGPLNYKDLSPGVPNPDAPGDIVDEYDFRNTIQNMRDQNFSGKLDMLKLYNKIKFLKDINTPKKALTPAQRAQQEKQQRAQQKNDTTKVKPPGEVPGVAKGLLRLLMSVRSINGTYTINEGTILPGFTQAPRAFGMDNNWDAPGWGFVLGSQNPGIRHRAANNGWLTENRELSMPFTQTRNTNLALRANVEPSSDFKVQIDIKKEISNSFQSIFRYDTVPGTSGSELAYQDLSPSRSGSYRISTISISTAFNSSNGSVNSEVFHKFEENIDVMRRRLQAANPGNEYDTAQDVLIPAFISAYTGSDPYKTGLTPFPKMPLPNWRIDYTGLNKLDIFKEVFQSITLSHGYSSSYSVLNYSNSLDYANTNDLTLDRSITDYNSSYYGFQKDGEVVPIYVISQVMISEQFSPLIGVNMRTKSRLSANFQYKTKRDLALTVTNSQITEMTSKDFSFELGYTKNKMKLPFKSQGRTIVLDNDLTFRMNVTVADTRTIQRKIGELNIITNGNLNYQLRPNISYVVNQKLNLQMYFERTINAPQISSSPRRATTRFGVQIRFSLAQ